MDHDISFSSLLLSFVFSLVLYVESCSVVLLRCTKQLAFTFTGKHAASYVQEQRSDVTISYLSACDASKCTKGNLPAL